MKAAIQRVLKEVREAKTVNEGLIVEIRELRARLEKAEEDPAAVEEAIELLDAMEKEGLDALAENTDGTFTPSGN